MHGVGWMELGPLELSGAQMSILGCAGCAARARVCGAVASDRLKHHSAPMPHDTFLPPVLEAVLSTLDRQLASSSAAAGASTSASTTSSSSAAGLPPAELPVAGYSQSSATASEVLAALQALQGLCILHPLSRGVMGSGGYTQVGGVVGGTMAAGKEQLGCWVNVQLGPLHGAMLLER